MLNHTVIEVMWQYYHF